MIVVFTAVTYLAVWRSVRNAMNAALNESRVQTREESNSGI
jgi:hypothetical protein